MPKTLIESHPSTRREISMSESHFLNISEMFGNTIQGEGIHTGVPATFIRLQHCTLACVWCDTLAVWREGNPYGIEELLTLLEKEQMIEKFAKGQHIVLTGGSPLLQQDALLYFIRRFIGRFGFYPIFEVENECTRAINPVFAQYINTWNNSPKLSNSGMKEKIRYKPKIIKQAAALLNSWFKFVVDCDEDWEEINEFFLVPNLIRRDQIILMPCGDTQKKLKETRETTVELAIRHNLRYCDRQHVTVWDKKTGV